MGFLLGYLIGNSMADNYCDNENHKKVIKFMKYFEKEYTGIFNQVLEEFESKKGDD